MKSCEYAECEGDSNNGVVAVSVWCDYMGGRCFQVFYLVQMNGFGLYQSSENRGSVGRVYTVFGGMGLARVWEGGGLEGVMSMCYESGIFV